MQRRSARDSVHGPTTDSRHRLQITQESTNTTTLDYDMSTEWNPVEQ